MSKTRIYLVENGDDVYLIEATSKATAINYIARKGIEAQVATQMQLVEMLAAGAKVEKAGNVVELIESDEQEVA